MDREAGAILSGSALFGGMTARELAGDFLRLGGVPRRVSAGRLLAPARAPYERPILPRSGRARALPREPARSAGQPHPGARDGASRGTLVAAAGEARGLPARAGGGSHAS